MVRCRNSQICAGAAVECNRHAPVGMRVAGFALRRIADCPTAGRIPYGLRLRAAGATSLCVASS